MTAPNSTLTRPVVNPDPIDRFLDQPLPKAEAAHVLAYYLPLVVDYSPPLSDRNEYPVARLHVQAAIGHRLDRDSFLDAALVGEQYENLRTCRAVAEEFLDWSADDFHEALANRIDNLLDGAA